MWRQGSRLDSFYFASIDLRNLREARRFEKSQNIPSQIENVQHR